jgi:hypothetical protein
VVRGIRPALDLLMLDAPFMFTLIVLRGAAKAMTLPRAEEIEPVSRI